MEVVKKIVRPLWRKWKRDKRIEGLYTTHEYLEAYSKHTDLRVERDPHEAVGGLWEKIGKLQFDFVVNQGLQPHHTLLDIGCGTLRGGRHFIAYLNAGNYSGIDLSPKAIAYGRQLVEQENLSEKHPRLLVNRTKDLRFTDFADAVFDYVLAQSVFTHLQPEHLEECFQHIGRIMKPDAAFFFTFNQAGEFTQTALQGFRYPFSFFQSLADRYGFILADCSREYKHPRRQRMARLSKTTPASSARP